MKKVLVGAAITGLALVGMSTTAGANPGGSIHWGPSSVTADLPPCHEEDSCNWELSVDEPFNGNVVIGTAHGSEGDLTVQIPAFCGVVQADLYSNGRYDFGHRMTYSTCVPPTTTTTTTTTITVPPVTTTTVKPPTTTTTTKPVVPPVTTGPPASSPPSVTPASPAPVVASPAPLTVPTTPTAATTPPHLAYTGVDYPLLAMVGAVLVGLGGLLMRRRRVAG